jgi:general stress protein 26
LAATAIDQTRWDSELFGWQNSPEQCALAIEIKWADLVKTDAGESGMFRMAMNNKTDRYL